MNNDKERAETGAAEQNGKRAEESNKSSSIASFTNHPLLSATPSSASVERDASIQSFHYTKDDISGNRLKSKGEAKIWQSIFPHFYILYPFSLQSPISKPFRLRLIPTSPLLILIPIILFLIMMNPFALNMLRCTLAAILLQPIMCAPLWIPSPGWPFQWFPRNDPATITTPFGTVTGSNMGSNVVRFTLPFAQPPIGNLRFANPQPIQSFNGHNASQMPPSCYQGPDSRGEAAPSEDCLYSTYYVPVQSSSNEPLPFIVWYHGGSGIVGSATQDGLDATKWASQQNVIVVVPQYRLNLFGWLSTNTTLDETNGGGSGSSTVAGNQAIRDVVSALQQIPSLANSMNGDAGKVTVMGQSSGATMVRALLTTPSAQSLFQNAILVSDPMDYGLSSIADNNFLGELAMEYLNCTTVECARQASADAILNATNTAYTNGPNENERISGGTPWRAMVGEFVTSSLATTQNIQKNLIFSTVQNEMGSLTGSSFTYEDAGATTLNYGGYPLSLPDAADLVFNQDRGETATNVKPLYAVDPNEPDGIRITFEELATDGVWRCAVQNMADDLTKAGSKVWLAEWQIGATYASNIGNSYCQTDGRVCHEDNIYLIFDTVPDKPTQQQTAASQEMQTRYSNFAKQNIPGAPNAVSWQPVSSSSALNILLVGQDGHTSINQTQHAPACSGQVWGSLVKFDWQIYPAA